MVIGMPLTQKVTVTLSREHVEAIRRLVGEAKVGSVSAFVQHAVEVALDDVSGWGVLLAEGLSETGGALTADEGAWADAVLAGVPPGEAA